MPPKIPPLLLPLLLAALLLFPGGGPAEAGAINPRLRELPAKADGAGEIGVIVTFADRVDPKAFRHLKGKSRRDAMVGALRERASRSQGELRRLLQEMGGREIHSLWAINALSCLVSPELLERIAALPGVEEVRPDETLLLPPFAPQGVAAPEWNLAAVGAPALWNLGLTGAGVVVASLDTGIDPNHADLAGRWRGGPGAWFDPYGQHATPHDRNGHGTAVMGVMVGGSAGSTAIGVAPGATWIAAKIFSDSGIATYSAIHRAFAWLLDPDGDGDTGDAPQIVNNSWGINLTNRCQTEFQPDLTLLKEGGIAVVFSAGNNGPKLSTSSSPANCPESLAVGATKTTGAVSSFSSRGPSPCTTVVNFPALVAPGEEIRSAGLTGGGSRPLSYVTMDGTSFAAPHVSGLLALLLEAGGFPDTPIVDLEVALEQSADDLGSAGPDYHYGYGLVNGLAAYRRLAGIPHLAVYDPTPPEHDRQLAFGNLPIGSSLSRSLTIRNSGNGQLFLGSLNASALTPPFTIAADSCSNTSLASDQSCELTVTFAPLAAATSEGSLALPSSDATQDPLNISITGRGLSDSSPPLLQFSPGNRTLAFGSVAPGATARLTLTISNGGEELLTISPINAGILPAPFGVALDECSGRSLAGQEACRIEFSFSPMALQTYQTALTISSNAGKAALSLSGLGNHPPEAASPLAPDNGATGLDPAGVTLRWQPATDRDGDAVSERISISEAAAPSPTLLGVGRGLSFPVQPLLLAGLTILAALVACSTLSRRNRPDWATLALLTAITLAGAACGSGGGNAAPAASSPGTHTATNLKGATTYNWTVLSTDSHGATSESATWQFTTR